MDSVRCAGVEHEPPECVRLTMICPDCDREWVVDSKTYATKKQKCVCGWDGGLLVAHDIQIH